MTFQRENRYIVIKPKDLHHDEEEALRNLISGCNIPTRECLVIESDWPEYEPAWRMIQARVEGAPLSPAHIEDGEEVEVVGYRSGTSGHIYAESYGLERPEPLMTVAQHQRIVAARASKAAPRVEDERERSRAVQAAFNDWSWNKKGEAVGRMDGQSAAIEGFHAGAEWQARAALSAPPAAGVPEGWQPMETAPKDGTLLRLLVEFEDHPIEDGAGPFATVGTNYRDNTGEDAWQIVGWCWEQDRFIDGVGTPVGWLPMLAAPPAAGVPVAWFTDWPGSRVYAAEPHGFDEHGLHLHGESIAEQWAPLYAPPTPPASEQQQAVVMPELTEQEREDLDEFYEAVCCDAGHRVSKEGMKRLAEIGAVESVGFGKHRLTEFGTYLLGITPPASEQQRAVVMPEKQVEYVGDRDHKLWASGANWMLREFLRLNPHLAKGEGV